MTFLIPILAFLAVTGIGGAVALAMALPRRAITPRLEAPETSFDHDVRAPSEPLAGIGRRLGEGSQKLREQLAKAGYHHESAAQTYLAVKVLLLGCSAPIAAAAVLPLDQALHVKLYLAGLIATVFFFAPNWYVGKRRKTRMRQIRNHLPDAVDLLEVCVTAGMGLDMAWNSVSEEIRPVCEPLADEMALVNLEIQLGAPRTDAMRHMADRTGATELASLVAMLVQSDRFGTSVAEALRAFAGSMREMRSQRAEEEAEKTTVKLLFPMVFFIFPALLVVMVGPAAITLVNVMGSG